MARKAAALCLALSLGACGGPEPNDATSVNDMSMDTNMAMDTNMSSVDSGVPSENQVAAVPTCNHLPASGARLEGRKLSGEGHQLRIDNDTGGDAIIKIRDAGTGRLVTSFFVRNHTFAGVNGLPDGSYTFQFAFGPTLAADCKSFTQITGANEFPDAGPFVTEPIQGGIRTRQLTYTLQPVRDGNTMPVPIDANNFNAP